MFKLFYTKLRILTLISLGVLGLFLFIPISIYASGVITKIDPQSLKINDYFTIDGSGFKAQQGDYDYICFSDTNSCLAKGSAAVQSWSDTRIVLKIPPGALSGQVFLVLEEQVQKCSNQICSTVGEQHNYYGGFISIIPTISGITKDMETLIAVTSASTGDTIHILGTGFEKNGQIYFDTMLGKVISWDDTHIIVQVPEIKLSVRKIYLRKANGISAEMNFSVSRAITNDPLNIKQQYIDTIHAQDVWKYTEGAGAVVAVIDIGVNLNHEDLVESIWKNISEIPNNGIDDDKNGYVDDQYGFNFGKNSAEILPAGDHGSMISGIIAAQKDNNKGISGVAPKAKIMPLQIDISAADVVSQVSKAIHYATDNGAQVINMSFVTPGRTYVPFLENDYKDALQYAYARGVVLVVAAGNGDVLGVGQNLNLNLFPQYPICNNRINGADILLGVSALDAFGEKLTTFSSYGDCVNIAAPGKDIISTSHPAFNNGQLYATQDGTSFAAPQVAAAAALLKSYKPVLRNWEIIQLLVKSTDTLPDGSRRLNIKSAFDMLSSSVASWSVVPVISSASYDSLASVLSLGGLYFKSGYRVNIQRVSDRYSQSVIVNSVKNETAIEIPIYFRLNDNETYAVSIGDDFSKSNIFELKTSGQSIVQPEQNQIQIQESVSQKVESSIQQIQVVPKKTIPKKNIKRSLGLGAIGTDVKNVKSLLKKQKLYKGAINTKFDKALKSAVQKFQKKYKFSQTGVISGKTRNKINEFLKKG